MSTIGPLRVTVSRAALVANARTAGDGIADLRRDAFGHGVAVVASALAEAGVRRVRVDEAGADAARAAGLEVVDSDPTLDSRVLYGLPGSGAEPVVRLTGSVLSAKPLLAGEGVSYNYTHVAERDTRIALVSGGFGQGVLRGLGNHVSVEIGGVRHPVVGRIAMDVCVVDIGDAAVAPGDEVVYFGGDGPARDGLAEWERVSGLGAAEIVCALGLRAASLGLRAASLGLRAASLGLRGVLEDGDATGSPAGVGGAVMRVDLPRLLADIDTLRARVAPADYMLVVKNDAYGHGIDHVVAAAAGHGVEWFGAFDIRMGVRARAAAGAGPRVFSWVTVGREEIAIALDAAIELGVGDAGYLEEVAAVSAGRRAPVHLKIDTGLHRNGVRPEHWTAFVARAAELERAGDIRVAGIWSHIAETSDATDDQARAEFHVAVHAARAAGLDPEVLHLAASAAGFARSEFRHDLVRFGAFSYGIRSTDGPELAGIVPAATLRAPVTRVDDDAVEVAYGSLDGLPSTLAGRATIGTPGGPRRLLAVGETSLTVEVWPGAAAGDEVAVFGPGTLGESSVTTLAEAIGTVGEEIVVRVSPLVPRESV